MAKGLVWQERGYVQVDVCCDNFAEATNSGTDNEGYGRLISKPFDKWKMGQDLPDIKYCPWCGKQT